MIQDQPEPTGEGQEVFPYLIELLQERALLGELRYGTPLRANNGRDALVDAWQEAADLLVYLTQVLIERESI